MFAMRISIRGRIDIEIETVLLKEKVLPGRVVEPLNEYYYNTIFGYAGL